MTETPNLDWWAEHFKTNPPETFCQRYGFHMLDNNGRCAGCGEWHTPNLTPSAPVTT